jgi:hypothetical protein
MGTPGIALGIKAGGAILGGLGGRAEAKAQAQQAKINAYIGKTRAIQTDTAAREGLSSELANFRTVMAANAQKAGVGTLEVQQDIRDVRNRERRVDVANRNQESSSYKMQAAAYNAAGRNAMIGGIVRAGPALYDLYQLRNP